MSAHHSTTMPTPRRGIRRRRLRAPAAPLLAAAALSVACADVAAAAPTPCTPAHSGRFNCRFYPAASPVVASDGRTVGTLRAGTNWVICQRAGGTVRAGAYYNHNWALTVADNGRRGWVNAVWARGGSNNGPFGGVPACPSDEGRPPFGGDGRAPTRGDNPDAQRKPPAGTGTTAPGGSAMPSCRRADVFGSSGTIHIQTSPSGTVAWGIYMHAYGANWGPWKVAVLVNGKQVDFKNQVYPPHGSVPPSRAPSGSVFSIAAVHVDALGRIHRSRPNACIVP